MGKSHFEVLPRRSTLTSWVLPALTILDFAARSSHSFSPSQALSIFCCQQGAEAVLQGRDDRPFAARNVGAVRASGAAGFALEFDIIPQNPACGTQSAK